MNEFKKCKVVVLNSNENTNLIKCIRDTPERKVGEILNQKVNGLNKYYWRNINIYILSDDEIKEGDYVYDEQYGFPNLDPKIYKWSYKGWIESPDFEDMKIQKIIASTDNSLNVLSLNQNFIEQYINNCFDEVLIEYAMQERYQSTARYKDDVIIENGKIVAEIDCGDSFELKNYVVNKDHFVVFKLIETSFNKEELPIQAIKDCLKYCENQQIYDKLSKYGDFYYKLNQFIRKNNL